MNKEGSGDDAYLSFQSGESRDLQLQKRHGGKENMEVKLLSSWFIIQRDLVLLDSRLFCTFWGRAYK